MNHPPEPVALQPLCSGYRGLPDEVEMAPVREPPKDFVLWSLFNTIFLNCFCCLGFLALVFSIKARDRKMVADLEGAQHYANTAKAFNITVTVLLVLCVIAAAVYIGIRIRTGVNLLNMLDGI